MRINRIKILMRLTKCTYFSNANPMTNDWTQEQIADEAIKQAELLVNNFYEKYNETC